MIEWDDLHKQPIGVILFKLLIVFLCFYYQISREVQPQPVKCERIVVINSELGLFLRVIGSQAEVFLKVFQSYSSLEKF